MRKHEKWVEQFCEKNENNIKKMKLKMLRNFCEKMTSNMRKCCKKLTENVARSLRKMCEQIKTVRKLAEQKFQKHIENGANIFAKLLRFFFTIVDLFVRWSETGAVKM